MQAVNIIKYCVSKWNHYRKNRQIVNAKCSEGDTMVKKFDLMKLVNIYFAFTIVYYCFGKYSWNIPSYLMLFAYLLLCYTMLNVGYRISAVERRDVFFSTKRTVSSTLPDYNKIRVIFFISSIFLIVFQIAWVVTFFGTFDLFNVLANIGDNYFERLQFKSDSIVPIMQVRTLLWGMTLFAYPLGFMYFIKMPLFDKILFIFTIFVDVMTSLNMGISKNLGDVVFVFFAVFMLKSGITQRKKAFRKNIIKIFFAFMLFLILFSQIQSSRHSVVSFTTENPYGQFAGIRENNLFYLIFGKDSTISGLIDSIGAYSSHAYTGLAYALTLPFESTGGIGFSRALMEYFEQYLNIDVSSATYNARIDMLYGWHNGQWWPTAFVWIGNAVSLWGVPIILLFLGKFIRYVEDDFFKTGNFISLALYAQMIITLIYLPCNMQIVQSRASLFGTLFLIGLFVLRRRVENRMFIKHKKNALILNSYNYE